MKKLLLIYLLISFNSVWACDICGGASSITGANGVIPFFNVNHMAMSFSQTSMQHPNTPFNQVGNAQVRKDELRRMNLHGMFFIHPKWQMQTSVPFVFNERVLDAKSQMVSGIGDVQTSFNYLLLNQSDSISQKVKALIFVGAGIGLPTGKYQIRGEDLAIYPNGMQPGIGAFQFSIQQQSSLRYQSFGLLFNSSARFSAVNEIYYQLGNIYSHQLHFFKTVQKGTNQWIPQLGLSSLVARADEKNGREVTATKINAINAHLAINWFHKQWNLEINGSIPLSQQLDYYQPQQTMTTGIRLGYLLIKE
jgi:hypothetical protein